MLPCFFYICLGILITVDNHGRNRVMNAPGKSLLKTVSILYIIIGAFFAVLMLLSLAIGPTLMGLGLGSLLGIFGGIVGGVLFIVFLIPAAVNLIIGIMGVRRSGNPNNANFFIGVGSILGALTLFSLFGAVTLWNLLGLVMPVLFIVGGSMNKKAARRNPVS